MSGFFGRSRSSGNVSSNTPAASTAIPGSTASSDSSRQPFPANGTASPSVSPEKERGSLGRRMGSSALLGMRSRASSQTSIKSNKSSKDKSAPSLTASTSTPAAATASSSSTSASGPEDGSALNQMAAMNISDDVPEELPSEMTGKQWRPRPGHPGNLSPPQSAALLELTGVLSTDGTLPPESVFAADDLEVPLCRFLRARGWNVAQAREMWNKSVEWKRSIDLDGLLRNFEFEEGDKVAKAGWQMYFHKVDKLGRPIFIQDLAGLDPNTVWTVTTPDRIIENFAVTLENAVRYRYRACTEATKDSRLIEDNLMILDVSGLGMSTFWNFKAQLQQLLSVLDNNFPELSGRVQIINAPWLFSTIWGYLKGWLPPNTVDKIDITGSDYQGVLLQFIDRENLPKKMGGACDCAGGCNKSDAGPWSGKIAKSSEAPPITAKGLQNSSSQQETTKGKPALEALSEAAS